MLKHNGIDTLRLEKIGPYLLLLRLKHGHRKGIIPNDLPISIIRKRTTKQFRLIRFFDHHPLASFVVIIGLAHLASLSEGIQLKG